MSKSIKLKKVNDYDKEYRKSDNSKFITMFLPSKYYFGLVNILNIMELSLDENKIGNYIWIM